LGQNWPETGGIQAFLGQIPVKLTGNFFARNREFNFVEQGIHFRRTGNSKRSLRCKRRNYGHHVHRQRGNRLFGARNWMVPRSCLHQILMIEASQTPPRRWQGYRISR
jgi:hypothetical protein